LIDTGGKIGHSARTLSNKTIIMQARLFTTTLLVVLSLGNGLLMAQSGGSIDIQGSRTKVTGTLQDAATIMAITTKNAGAMKGQTITIGRETDPSSPNLYQAYQTKEVLPKVVFKVFKPGDPTKYKIITLTNATITKAGSRSPQPNTGHTGGKPQQENISFTFTEISVQYFAGSTSTSDDWTANNQ
jgi:type VI secretion system Hcp family effector